MKYQMLFSGEKKRKYFRMSFAKFFTHHNKYYILLWSDAAHFYNFRLKSPHLKHHIGLTLG